MIHERPFMIVRETGERIYLDDGIDETKSEEAVGEEFRPAPAIYVECELCGRPELQVEWTKTEPPFICIGCACRSRYGLKYGDVPQADHVFLGRAHAALSALKQEIANAKRVSA